MATTTKLGDYLGRALVNDNPGTSNATDFLGRNVSASDKDSIGRALVNNPTFPPPDRANSTAYTLGQRVKVPGTNEVQTVAITGTPDGGNFKLDVTNRGSTVRTPVIAHDVNTAALQSIINGLSNVEPGDITVGGTNPNFTLTYQSERGDVAEVAAADVALTGGTDPDVDVGTTTEGAFNGQIYEATVAGTSAGSAPSVPAVGATVTDGGVTWRRLS